MAGTGSLANTDLGSHKLPVPLDDPLSELPILELLPFLLFYEPRGRTDACLGHLVHAFVEQMNLHDAEAQSLNHLHLKAHGIVRC